MSVSGVDISISYQYYRSAFAYRNIAMYFEYHDIFRYSSENWKNSKLKKGEEET